MALQRTRCPRFRSSRSLCSLGSPRTSGTESSIVFEYKPDIKAREDAKKAF
jgi:hypothetical protein